MVSNGGGGVLICVTDNIHNIGMSNLFCLKVKYIFFYFENTNTNKNS